MVSILVELFNRVDWSQRSLYIAIASILFNPVYWNILARSEYRNKTLTKLAGGNRLYGCYGLAVSIFSLGILRDHLYSVALNSQPTWSYLAQPGYYYASIALFITGSTLVLTSMYALGVTGTYLGDYFGILMHERVTGFPFNVSNNPMYDGSTMCFLSTALWKKSPAGVLLTGLVYAWYRLALRFEEPFTDKIYANRDTTAEKRSEPATTASPAGKPASKGNGKAKKSQ